MSTQNSTLIRSAKPTDAEAIARIYNHYVTETIATFEVDEVSSAEMARRIEGIQSESFSWLVAERDESVVGYAYAGKWHSSSIGGSMLVIGSGFCDRRVIIRPELQE